MFNMDFFYDEKLYSDSVSKKVREAKIDNASKYFYNLHNKMSDSNLHKVADPDVYKVITLVEAVVIMNEEALKPKGINLYLLSQKS